MPRLQYMPINDFDRGLVQKFEAHDYEYNPAQWDRLAKQLPPAKNSRIKRYIWLPVSGIAAAIALLLGIPAVMQKNKDNASNVAATTKAPERPVKAAGPANIVPATPSVTATITTTTTNTTSNVGISNTSRNHTFLNNSQPVAVQPSAQTPTRVIPLVPDVPVKNEDAPVVTPQNSLPVNNIEPIANNITPATPKHPGNPVPDPVIAREVVAAKPQIEAPVLKSTEQPAVVKSMQPPVNLATSLPETQQLVNTHFGNAIDPDDIGFNKNAKKTSLSLAGAYNRGSNNLGYMVGVNTRRSLGGKLYLEGDVAFASARNDLETYDIDRNSLDAPTKKVLLTSGNSPKALVGSELSKDLYYLQVTPVVGYQVMKNLSFGAGADVQRLFQSGDKTKFVVDKDANAVKTAPTLDYGLVGKTEYTLFRSLKAGVQYRYGLNEVLAPGKDYINRSYLQVQLKLGILGNK